MTASASDGSHGTAGAPRPGAPARSAARPAWWVPLACVPPSSTRWGGQHPAGINCHERAVRSVVRDHVLCGRVRRALGGHAPARKNQSNRNHSSHAQAIPSAPGAATAALASHAVCLRPHRFGPGRPGSLGRAGTPPIPHRQRRPGRPAAPIRRSRPSRRRPRRRPPRARASRALPPPRRPPNRTPPRSPNPPLAGRRPRLAARRPPRP
jgi:hypothetical protein